MMSVSKDIKKLETLYTVKWKHKMVQPSWKKYGDSSKN
jgi:hypothetical protein